MGGVLGEDAIGVGVLAAIEVRLIISPIVETTIVTVDLELRLRGEDLWAGTGSATRLLLGASDTSLAGERFFFLLNTLADGRALSIKLLLS